MATWTTLTDEALIAATPRERAAFGVFYERHERAVLGFFGAITRRPEVAADLTAETFAAALDSVSGFDASLGTARMWLFGIARHVLARSARRGRVESGARERIGLDPLGVGPECRAAWRTIVGALLADVYDETPL